MDISAFRKTEFYGKKRERRIGRFKSFGRTFKIHSEIEWGR